jgi:hypothetical protein
MGDYKNSDKVNISGFDYSAPIATTFLDKPRKKKLAHKFSKRSIKKVSRANNRYRVVERGRTSLDKPSFGLRTSDTSLTESIVNEILSVSPATHKIYEPFISLDEEAGNANEINEEGLMNWLDYEGLEHAMKVHDDSIAIRKKWDKHIYFYSSAEPFESLMRWGVLDLNNKAKINTMKILKRTAYFSTIGLFRLDDVKFSEFASQTVESPSFIMSDFRSTRASVEIHADKILPMKDYRPYKAKALLKVRESRNAKRLNLKRAHADYLVNPVDYSLSAIEAGLGNKVNEAVNLVEELISVTFAFENKTWHQVENKQAVISTYNAFLQYVYSYTNDIDSAYELMPKSVAKKFKNNTVLRTKLQKILNRLNDFLVGSINGSISDFISVTTKSIDTLFEMVEAIGLPFKSINKSIRYDMNDSPATIVCDIEW